MRIKCGEYDVCANGSVIAYEDHPVEMVLSDDGEEIYTFRLSFKNDQGNVNERTEFRPLEDNVMEVNFVNANRAFGIGPQKPVEIGAFLGRKLYFSYRIYATSSSFKEKLLHYTWLLGEKIEEPPAEKEEQASVDPGESVAAEPEEAVQETSVAEAESASPSEAEPKPEGASESK